MPKEKCRICGKICLQRKYDIKLLPGIPQPPTKLEHMTTAHPELLARFIENQFEKPTTKEVMEDYIQRKRSQKR